MTLPTPPVVEEIRMKTHTLSIRPRPWQRGLSLVLAVLIASGPALARGPGRAGLDALMDDPDALAPQGANLPAYMQSNTEQTLTLPGNPTVSGQTMGVTGNLDITVSVDAVGGGPLGMSLGAPEYSASGELVVALENVKSDATVSGRPAVPAVNANFGRFDLIPKLTALKLVEIPPVAGLEQFVRDRNMAIVLGKAFFWDAMVGSDGNACASCHFAAGADNRLKNQLSPGLKAGDHAFLRHFPKASLARLAKLRKAGIKEKGHVFKGMSGGGGGPNYLLKEADFPFYRLSDELDRNSPVLFETNDVVSSQGTFAGDLMGAKVDGSEKCSNRPLDEFNVQGALTRKVAPRNSPSVINAVFNYRNFWDGRANNVFNGNNPFGNRDVDARVLELRPDGTLVPVAVALPNASLASQAVGPALSDFEMNCAGNDFKNLGRKVLPKRALEAQQVDLTDSVLAAFVAPKGKGLKRTYAQLVQQAFHPNWWSGKGQVGGYTQMENNFSLFWGLAIMLYESTLVSDEAPVDRFVGWAGTPPDAKALGPAEQRGLVLFREKAMCVSCHKGAEFTGAATALQPNRESNLTEHMFVGSGGDLGMYDNGFYNIGVRPTDEDLGVGAQDPFGNPLSFSRQYLDRLSGKQVPDGFQVMPCLFAVKTDSQECWTTPDPTLARVGVDGAFKTPGLRNIALTKPYFHNGSRFTLEQVVDFYNRGGDRRGPDGNDTTGYLAADAPQGGTSNGHPSVRSLGLSKREKADLVAFLRNGLTDRRVACQQAPFDHPSLRLTNGHVGNEKKTTKVNGRAVDEFVQLPAVGSGGLPSAVCLLNDNGTPVK